MKEKITVKYFHDANKLKQEGKLEEAIVFYYRCIEENPNFYFSYHNLGEVLAKVGRYEEAITAYNCAINLNPNSAWTHHNLGEVLVEIGHVEVAIVEYRRAIALQPKNHIFYSKLGKIFYQLAIELESGNLSLYLEQYKLEEILSKSVGNKKYYTELYYLNDESFLQTTSTLFNEAFLEKVYHTYLQREPDFMGKKQYLQHLCNGMTRQELVAGFRQSPEFTSLLIFSITSFFLGEAIATYRQAIELNPDSGNSRERLGEALLQMGKVLAQRDKIDEAIENYQQAIAISRGQILAEAHYNQGNSLLQQQKLDEAVASYQQTIAIRGDWMEAHLAFGHSLFKKDNLEDATKSFQQAIAIQPEVAQTHIYLGNTLLKQDKLNAAIQSFQQAISIHPASASLYSQIAYFFLEKGYLKEAIDYYQNGIAIDENLVELHLGLGTSFLQYGEKNRGIESFQQAMALVPNWIHIYIAMGTQLFISGDIDQANQAWHEGIEKQRKLAEEHQLSSLGIRFLDPNSWLLALGHICCLDIYLKMGILGWRPKQKTMMLVDKNTKVPNRALLNYWKPYIDFISAPSQIPISASLVDYVTDFYWAATLPSGKTLMNSTQTAAMVYQQWEAEKRPPLLSLSDSDAEGGWDCLQKLGMPKNAWFISLHVRESGFHINWNKVHPATRDADINSYLLAIQSITERGGWVIRMGDSTMKPLPKMDKLIDYAHSEFKSDWMDIFLCASCKFLIGTSSGMSWLPPIFGIPCALTNWIPIGLPPSFPKNIFIPKLYYLEEEKRYLTFVEIFSSPIIYAEFRKYYDSRGLTVVDNTADEINDVVLEMLNYQEGKINYSREDDSLQEKFHTLATTYGSYRGSRIGQAFLKKYANLFNIC
ncbi:MULTISPECIES: TIGR04372 family glycosyltransferase [unclassified Microcoleus]|uniref:TIGR04372 family glycosyltransferase n=1 Tax=unclassified Microcoleus TaxID=2642155 RepID=UPI002FD049D6